MYCRHVFLSAATYLLNINFSTVAELVGEIEEQQNELLDELEEDLGDYTAQLDLPESEEKDIADEVEAELDSEEIEEDEEDAAFEEADEDEDEIEEVEDEVDEAEDEVEEDDDAELAGADTNE